jgi:UDP-3-O-[3-hydroxymyristoyl] glucosamine N-acyltransferase
MTKMKTVKELSILIGAKVIGDENRVISGVNTLNEASDTDVSFLANSRYLEAMKKSKAGVICVDSSISLDPTKTYLVCESPSFSFQKIIELLLPKTTIGFTGIHPTAVIHPSAVLGKNITLGPYCVIDQNSCIGDDTVVVSHVYIGPNTKVGSKCTIYPHCTIREQSVIKDRVILQPGCVIGSCGFGYTPNASGNYEKLEQLGSVLIENDVEIGANTAIDRSRFKETIIGKGTKIDNLCQIAHNVCIGPHNAIAALTGIAGSTKTGSHVIMGGQVGVTGHIEIEDQVQIAAKSGVSKSLKKGSYRGSPALPIHEANRLEVYIRKLPEITEKLKSFERKNNQSLFKTILKFIGLS